jgi:TRAP-type C4-dicarboxylate transport system substrate-binding protein
LANTVTYGVHKYHRYHTLSSHFYLSRGVWVNRDAFASWPDNMRAAMDEIVPEAVAYQRGLAVEEEEVSRRAIEVEGCEIVELTAEEHAVFAAKVAPLHEEARDTFGDAMFDML